MRTSSQNSLYLLVVISVNHRYDFVELDSSALCQSLGISTDPSLYSVPKGAYEADMYTTNCSIIVRTVEAQRGRQFYMKNHQN